MLQFSLKTSVEITSHKRLHKLFTSAVLYKVSISITNAKKTQSDDELSYKDIYKWRVEQNLKRQRHYFKIYFDRVDPGAKHKPV